MARTDNVRLYGTSEVPLEWVTLSAGPLEADLENGQLRYIRFGGVEVLRAVSFLARDIYWGTFGAEIDDLRIVRGAGRFSVRYSARCAPEAGDLHYDVEITGEAAGRLRFVARGAPRADFLTNRTGFVVLHPLDGVAGAEVEIEHASGGTETVALPAEISPHEPARDIFAIAHQAAPGLRVRVEMTGDAYDMEDQRNWTDASLKTYIRPLSKPKPYTMSAGETFEQSVTLMISGPVPTRTQESPARVVTTGSDIGTMPRIALGVEGGDAARSRHQLPNGVAAIIGRPATPEQVPALVDLARSASADLSLQFAIPGHDPKAELAAWNTADAASVLATPYRLYPLRPDGVTPGTVSLTDIARATRAAFPRATIGGGVMTGFTEFNRNRPPLSDVDFITHVTSAIVHAADDRSVIESLDSLPHVFRSARALAGDKSYRIGPSGIGLGLNPDGPPRRANSSNARATMIRNDPRQRGLFAAAWTLGYAAAAVANGVEEYAPAHIAGDFGMFDDDGALRPIYHVVRALAASGGAGVTSLGGLPEGCRGMSFGGNFWIANLTPETRHLRFAQPLRYAILDATSIEKARTQPDFLETSGAPPMSDLDLLPFAVARVSP